MSNSILDIHLTCDCCIQSLFDLYHDLLVMTVFDTELTLLSSKHCNQDGLEKQSLQATCIRRETDRWGGQIAFCRHLVVFPQPQSAKKKWTFHHILHLSFYLHYAMVFLIRCLSKLSEGIFK